MKNRKQQHMSPAHFTRSLLQHAKPVWWYTTITVATAIALGCICLLPVGANLFDGLKTVQVIGFAGLGFAHAGLLYKRLPFLHRNFSREGLWFTLLLVAVILIALAGLYMITDPGLLPVSMACISGFLFPFLIYRAWFFYSHIPTGIYSAWYLPEYDTTGYAATARNSQPVRLKLSRSYFDTGNELFDVSATPQIKLGRLFYNIVEEKNRQSSSFIQVKDEDQRPFGWEFYTNKWWGLFKRRLNPDKSLLSNKIKKNMVVYVKRMRGEASQVPQQMIAV